MTTDTRHTRLLIGLGVVAVILLAKISSTPVIYALANTLADHDALAL